MSDDVLPNTVSELSGFGEALPGDETVGPDLWDALFGAFNDDPSWADFPRWLEGQRRPADETDLRDEDCDRSRSQSEGLDIVPRQPHERVGKG